MNNKLIISFLTILSMFIINMNTQSCHAERIKDIVDIKGIRSNPLSGFGLVVGLSPGKGDSALSARKMLSNLLKQEELNLSPDDFISGSVAVVAVTAELGPFDREGAQLDVTVSAIGDAKSLQGGRLLATELKGLDGEVYAVAAGSVSIGGWSAEGKAASASKNHQTVGRIPSGANVERQEIAEFIEYINGLRFITFTLRNNDFSTAQRIDEAISSLYPANVCVEDAGTIRVRVPDNIHRSQVVAFIDRITELNVKVDTPAVVVINERTGTIVVGENVGISRVAIAQGSLIVKVKETQQVSQPTANFSDAGETKVVDDTSIGIEEEQAYLIPVDPVVTVSELAKALNSIGATPRDMIAIFNALKQAGALQARLEIM